MASDLLVHRTVCEPARGAAPPAEPCLLVLFGASGDLTRRLLMPALYNLACDGLLSPHFALVGTAWDGLSSDEFRARMTADIKTFGTRGAVDPRVWDDFARRIYYQPGDFADPASYGRLAETVTRLDAEYGAAGNVLFYLAVPPSVFGLIATHLDREGLRRRPRGWARLVVEKPFGHDLASAVALNRTLLAHWDEGQIYRIDHYLGKETVQNLLAFRFANGIFEPLWNKGQVDHIQFTVSETVGVEHRARYYEGVGVLRDMIQNHMFQMLAYLTMEPPASFAADAVRNEKAKLLSALRVLRPEEVPANAVRGQYGPGRKEDGAPAAGYREEPDVKPQSATETFAALRLFIDNWRWEGVPVYLRSGKALWKRGTEIAVQFKKAPEVIFRGTPAAGARDANMLLFHMQPDQGIELRLNAKTPGPALALQKVNMRFDYREAFEASRGTGYEVLLYNAMTGDATLFSRTDLVETAWRVAQPILDFWGSTPPEDFPNYPAGSWGPKPAFDLLARDGRGWAEVINRDVLSKVPLFQGGSPVLLQNLAMVLKPVAYPAGDFIIRKGEVGREMYVVCRGQVEVLDGGGRRLSTLGEGDFFGELSLLWSQPRSASVRAVTPCDLFVLEGPDFNGVVKSYPQFAHSLEEAARTRYQAAVERGTPQ
jgi:glucose-6-phosphate 1-dehydrogenase